MNIDFRPYQEIGIQKVVENTRFGIWFDPGLGKTLLILESFRKLVESGKVKNMLIIGPKRICQHVWSDEMDKFGYNFVYNIFTGKSKSQREALLDVPCHISIINYDLLEWLFVKEKRHHYDMIVVDEATYIKKNSSKRHKLVRKYSKSAKRVYTLTGTPTPNGLLDIYGHACLISPPGTLGRNYTQFCRDYFYPSGYLGYEWTPREGSEHLIAAKLSPYVYRVKAEDVLPDLPERTTIEYRFDLSAKTMKQYKTFEKECILSLDDASIVAMSFSAATMKLRQIANGGAITYEKTTTIIHREKAEALEELLESLGNKHAIIVYEFNADLDLIAEVLTNKKVSWGSVKDGDDGIFDRWNNGDIQYLVAQYRSISHGLNLQKGGHYLILFSLFYDLDAYEQLWRRIVRPGQESDKCFIYHLMARHTVDETINKALKTKETNQRKLLERFRNEHN